MLEGCHGGQSQAGPHRAALLGERLPRPLPLHSHNVTHGVYSGAQGRLVGPRARLASCGGFIWRELLDLGACRFIVLEKLKIENSLQKDQILSSISE